MQTLTDSTRYAVTGQRTCFSDNSMLTHRLHFPVWCLQHDLVEKHKTKLRRSRDFVRFTFSEYVSTYVGISQQWLYAIISPCSHLKFSGVKENIPRKMPLKHMWNHLLEWYIRVLCLEEAALAGNTSEKGRKCPAPRKQHFLDRAAKSGTRRFQSR